MMMFHKENVMMMMMMMMIGEIGWEVEDQDDGGGEGECSHVVLLDLLLVTILMMTGSQVLGRVTPT